MTSRPGQSRGTGRKRRAAIAVGAAALLACATFALVRPAGPVVMVPLYTALDSSNLAWVSDELRQLRVAHRFSDRNDVFVPRGQLAHVRARLAARGLPPARFANVEWKQRQGMQRALPVETRHLRFEHFGR